ncbi:EAL domain-containing protein [Ralstonia sp. 1138]|uniref:sensor domain-containing phosphodiesterase n=1 Tax=Ralstonia sp. 1138 TaxID=3156423 RepID=UPI0033930D1A
MEEFLAGSLIQPHVEAEEVITQIVRTVRTHLRMPYAFVSEFVGSQRVFRYVDSSVDPPPFRPGDADPVAESLCIRVAKGRLPTLIHDATRLPDCDLSTTRSIRVGAHISVPIERADGSVFGMFCCFSDRSDHSLNSRDLELMTAFSRVIGLQIDTHLETTRGAEEKRARVRSVVDSDKLTVVFQPIRSLLDLRLVGLEVLSRFPGGQDRPPYLWFADAWEAGIGEELEMLAIRKGLQALNAYPHAYLAVNASPKTILSGKLDAVFRNIPAERVVLEITEHALVEDYTDLQSALRPLRQNAIRVAIDDAGSGYATMRHIIELKPDIIKLDARLTTDLEYNPTKRALIKAMVTFASEIRCGLVAEGIEHEEQKALLVELGVRTGQGYLLGRPGSLATLGVKETVGALGTPVTQR